MARKTVPFSLRIKPDILDDLRNAAQFRAGYPFNDSISAITERAVAQYLSELRREMSEELQKFDGQFPKRIGY